jgi:hypothetical protein
VQNIGGNIYVTYAPPGVQAQRNATPGMGAVAIFDENGKFLRMAADSTTSPRRGALLSPRLVSVSLAATCWSAISALA